MRATAAIAIAALAVAPACLADPPATAPWMLSREYADGARHMGIRLLGTVRIGSGEVDGEPLYGLSGLAWDADDEVLYAVSDGGRVFHLRPILRDGILVDVRVLAGFALRDGGGRALSGRASDAEGLAVLDARNGRRGDARLLVSFERIPRIEEFAPDGRRLRDHPLPPDLADVGRYESANRALESVAMLPGIGIVTAAERPLRGERSDTLELRALDGPRWSYRLHPLANAALVDLEPLPDGGLLTLERGYGFLFVSISTAVRRTTPLRVGAPIETTTLAVIDSARGWRTDNFEGLARHEGMRFFAVSDDNRSPLQNTLLAYFELVEGWTPGDPRDFETRQESAR